MTISILFENGYFHHVENLKTNSCFVFEILNKILLGALGSLLSILLGAIKYVEGLYILGEQGDISHPTKINQHKTFLLVCWVVLSCRSIFSRGFKTPIAL